jgi:hypothetical protein
LYGPLLGGGVEIIEAPKDDDFFTALRKKRWTAVVFVPALCRSAATGKTIPGGNDESYGWTMKEYHDAVRKHQPDANIVSTVDDGQLVTLLREGLGMDAKSAINRRKVGV